MQTSANSQSLGYFQVEDLPDGATYRLTVSKNGYIISPSEVTFEMTEDKQQDFTGLEYPPTGTLSASPNPIQVCDPSGQGAPTLTWSATGVTAVQIRRGTPDGPLVGSGGTSGSVIASQVTNGTVFYLQNVTGGLPLTAANTLATATVTITQQGCPVFTGVFNKTINYAYNSVGALSSVGTDLIAGANSTNTTNVLNTVSFRSSGALSSVNYGNGRRLTMGYNNDRSQPISMKVDRVTNSADKIIDYQYDYYDAQGNNNNRIRKITDNIDPQFTTTYSYDGYNRLQGAQWSGDGRTYQYDEWGNIRSVNFGLTYHYATSANGAPATNRLDSVALNGVTQTSYSYDAAGNTVSGEGKTFAYDAVNRLKSVNNGTSTYGYEDDGKRVRVTDGSAAVYYVYSSKLGQSVMEVTQAGVQRAYVYLGGGKLVAMQGTDGQFYWLHTNHLGSSRAMTDSNGNLTYKGHFDPFGQTLSEWSSSGNNNLNSKKFTGYERDIATGLDYADARMYNSNRGRFTKPDPMGLKAADPKRPETLNRYAYVGNDPINYVDRKGLFGEMTLCGMIAYSPIGGERSGWGISTFSCTTFGGTGNGNTSSGIPLLDIDLSGLANLTAQKKCPWKPDKLDKVLDYLSRSKIDELIDSTRVADNGAGFILTFKDGVNAALAGILNNKDYWAGGEFGGQLHEDELKNKFQLGTAYFYDYRSFNSGNTTLGDRSMQVTLIYRDKDRQELIGAYVDTDQFNFRQDLVGATGQTHYR